MSLFPGLQEALALCIRERLTFAAFRTPGGSVRIWAQVGPGTEGADWPGLAALEKVFVVAPFTIDPQRIPFIRADVELTFTAHEEEGTGLQACRGSDGMPDPTDAPTGKQEFMDAVDAAKQACAEGRLGKVVLSRVKEADIPASSWPDLFIWAMQDNPHTLVAMACTPEHGLWMGASPERLVKASGDHVRVDSIAATRPVEAVPPTIREWGEKELDEQARVTEYLRDLFAELRMHGTKVQGPQVLKAGPVAHLHTVLEAELHGTSLATLVSRLHPTPAVCGTPTDKARRFIRHHEGHDRSLYAGFWGPWNMDGTTELFVNLRCMRLKGGGAQLMVGAGITAGSDPAMEWTETERKARTWLRALENGAQAN